MHLYIDETENSDYFIVSGLLAEPVQVQEAYKRFKKKAHSHFLKPREKARVFTEFKSVLLDRSCQRIKTGLLEEIVSTNGMILCSFYKKNSFSFNQSIKEAVYILLLTDIIDNIQAEIHVVFDSFNKKDFERRIVSVSSVIPNVLSVTAKDSMDDPGIQFADNICSVLRTHLSGKSSCFYDIIKERIIYMNNL